MALLLGSANRDERKYEHPDDFDIFRASRQSVGFGFGVHVCLGMHLARMETRVAINTLFDRLARPAAGPGPGPGPPHQGHGLPLTDRPAGRLHPVLTGAGRCDTPSRRRRRPLLG